MNLEFLSFRCCYVTDNGLCLLFNNLTKLKMFYFLHGFISEKFKQIKFKLLDLLTKKNHKNIDFVHVSIPHENLSKEDSVN